MESLKIKLIHDNSRNRNRKTTVIVMVCEIKYKETKFLTPEIKSNLNTVAPASKL